MKKQIILYMLCLFAALANAQTIPQSINKPTTPKPQKAPQKVVVIQKPVYIVKSNDRDGDGLSDAIDECPDEKGTTKNNGCPEKKGIVKNNDRDGDGLSDAIDECPDEKGSPKNNGCPEKAVIENKMDRDGDGLSDDIDECPDEKGSPKNNGCPEKIVSIPLPEIIEVAGGSFMMGGTEKSEKPKHNVMLSSFGMAKTETTVAQWRAYCNATGQAMPEAPSWGWTDKAPIVNVSWEDVVAYCDWLSDKTGKTYRLPTEAEWEYAARGGSKSNGYTYAGSDDLDEAGWSSDNAGGKTQACGRKKPNELGLYDMSGNVYEWCKDWYSDTYYRSSPASNPRGPSSGSYHVVRGGGWINIAAFCRVGYRNIDLPGYRSNNLGFRVVVPQ